jgi:hypothetical protein
VSDEPSTCEAEENAKREKNMKTIPVLRYAKREKNMKTIPDCIEIQSPVQGVYI